VRAAIRDGIMPSMRALKTVGLTPFVLLVAFCLSGAAVAQAQPQFLSLSDIHFDPYYDTTLLPKLIASDASQWRSIFESSSITAPNSYGHDSNYPLFRSALADAKTRIPAPAFILISGDFLAHDFPELFQKYSSDDSPATYQSFVARTMQFVVSELTAAFPNTRIFPALGNNDSDCGDYEITPNGTFLKNWASVWAGPVGTPSSFAKDVAAGGYYTADLPGLKDTRLIVLNTIFFAVKYDDACGTGSGPDPGTVQLQWLARVLRRAERDHKKVWLLYHIPSGIDVYASTDSPSACPSAVSMWQTSYTAAFTKLIVAARGRVTASFAGHTHMDDFRVVPSPQAGVSSLGFVHITPAISPLFSNNPGYHVFRFQEDGRLDDYTAYSLPVGTPGAAWQTEYAFDTAYAQPACGVDSLRALISAIGADAATRAMYIRFYTSSNASSTTITETNWRGYWCGTQTQTGPGFTGCYCP
jgi:sphingomyelin phosphodiesterase acid-like 3